MVQSFKVSWEPDHGVRFLGVWASSDTPIYRTYAAKTFNKIFVVIYDTINRACYTGSNACLVVLFKRALMYGTKL